MLLQSFIDSVVLEISYAGLTREGDEVLAMVDLYLHSLGGSGVSVGTTTVPVCVFIGYCSLACSRKPTSIVNW